MPRDKFMAADAAVAMIRDGDTVCVVGGGGGLMEASCLFSAVEKRFLDSGHPRDLTVVHSLGIGDRKTRGMNCFAHEGMVKRVIGGHWVWSPRMQEMARDEKIEAYVLPGGCIMQLYREIAAKRPGLFTHVGLGTFVDPQDLRRKAEQARQGGPRRAGHDRRPGVPPLQAVPGQRRADPRLFRRCRRQYQPRPGGGEPRDLCGRRRRPQLGRQGHRAGPHRGGSRARCRPEPCGYPRRLVDAVVVDPAPVDDVRHRLRSDHVGRAVRPGSDRAARTVHGSAGDRAPGRRGARGRRGHQLRLRHSRCDREAGRRARPSRPLLSDDRARHLWRIVAHRARCSASPATRRR